MQQGERKIDGHAAMLAVNVIFGLNMTFSKSVLALESVTPFALNTFRTTGAALLFWAVSLFLPREKVSKRDILLLFAASLFGVQINQLTFLLGLNLTSPINAAILGTSLPILTMMLSAAMLHEPISFKKCAGVAIGLAGALILVISSASGNHGGGSLLGDALCLFSALLYACYLVFFRNLIKRYSAVTLMKWMFLFATVCSAPYCWGDFFKVDFGGLALSDWLNICFVVCLATFTAYILIPVGQHHLRPTTVSMYNYVQPIVASLTAVVVMGEPFGWYKAVAAIAVFVGVWLVTRSPSREQIDGK